MQEVACGAGNPLTPTPGDGHSAAGKAAVLLFVRTRYEQTRQNRRGAPVWLFFMCDIKTRSRAAVVSKAPAAFVRESKR